MRLLVCGGAGFIGSAFVKNFLRNNPDSGVVNLDIMGVGSNPENLRGEESDPRYRFVKGDIRDEAAVAALVGECDTVVNFAAESHVDRSISDPRPFLDTNVLGTYSVLEAVRRHGRKLVHVSTDEVYGDAPGGSSFDEEAPARPGNPYAATKAAADHLVASYHRTYGIDCVTTRCTNNFGPRQFPEKLIPKAIIRAVRNLRIPLYGDGSQIRSWIHVSDHVGAIEALIERGRPGRVYNITAYEEVTNREIVERILGILKRPASAIEFVGDRPGHDRRYSIDCSRLEGEVGWRPALEFGRALADTVEWYLGNRGWWEPLVDERTLHPQPWILKA